MKKTDRCPTCHRLYRRSNPQNARYWALLHAMEGFDVRNKSYSAETWHRFFKSKFLGCVDYILPNGKTLIEPNSTAMLDKEQFDHFLTAVEAFCNERGIYLEDRDELTR